MLAIPSPLTVAAKALVALKRDRYFFLAYAVSYVALTAFTGVGYWWAGCIAAVVGLIVQAATKAGDAQKDPR